MDRKKEPEVKLLWSQATMWTYFIRSGAHNEQTLGLTDSLTIWLLLEFDHPNHCINQQTESEKEVRNMQGNHHLMTTHMDTKDATYADMNEVPVGVFIVAISMYKPNT